MVGFREASVDDPDAHALIAEYFDMRAATFPMDLGDYRAAFPEAARFTPPAGIFLIVVKDGEDVGCGGIKRIPVPEAAPVPVPEATPVPEAEPVPEALEGARYEIKHLWIQPRMQGRGLGRALLTELERRARGFGATELVLDTNASLLAAGGMYRSSGYKEIAPYNDNPNATHWFRKALIG